MLRKSIPGLQLEKGTAQSSAAPPSPIPLPSDGATRWRRRHLQPQMLRPQTSATSTLTSEHPQAPPTTTSSGAYRRGYLRPPASNMATKSKGCCDCCTAGHWHLLLPRPLPRFILQPPELLPGGPKKIHRPCFLSCLSIPSQRGKTHIPKQTHTHTNEQKKKEGAGQLPVLLSISSPGQRCCLLHSAA